MNTEIAQTLAEYLNTLAVSRRRCSVQVSYPREFRWLLRIGYQFYSKLYHDNQNS